MKPVASGCHPERGVLINALATAGTRRVDAEDAFSRCFQRPEHIKQRLVLGGRAAIRRAEEAEASRALDWWEFRFWLDGLGGNCDAIARHRKSDWTDSAEIAFHLALIFGQDTDRLVIHGNCGNLNHKVRDRCVPIGADVLAGWCAAGVGAAVETYPVDHRLDGPWPEAGPRRNERMFRESRPDRGLAFGPLWKRAPPPRQEKQCGLFDVAAVMRLEHTGTGGMVKIMLDAGMPARWVAAPGNRYVDLLEMPRP